MSTTVNAGMFTLLSVTTFHQRLMEVVAEKRKLGIDERQIRRELAEALGTSRSNLSHWFNGRCKAPEGHNVVGGAVYFEVEPLWFGKGEGPKRAREGAVQERRKERMLAPKEVDLLRDFEALPPRIQDNVRRSLQDLAQFVREKEEREKHHRSMRRGTRKRDDPRGPPNA